MKGQSTRSCSRAGQFFLILCKDRLPNSVSPGTQYSTAPRTLCTSRGVWVAERALDRDSWGTVTLEQEEAAPAGLREHREHSNHRGSQVFL